MPLYQVEIQDAAVDVRGSGRRTDLGDPRHGGYTIDPARRGTFAERCCPLSRNDLLAPNVP
jgi:hypothetical protein